MDNQIVFDFNKIIVIESLRKHEQKTGRKLFDSIIKKFPAKAEYFKVDYKEVNSKRELFNLFNDIKEEVVKTHYFPFIHFEVHGSKEGLVLNSAYKITWEILTKFLREINIATKNNLFVSFASCHAAFIFQEIDILKKCPFVGFVAPFGEIRNYEIEETFETFFSELLMSLNVHGGTADFNIP